MLTKLRFDYSNALTFVSEKQVADQEQVVKTAHHMLHNNTGPGKEYLGWVGLPFNYDRHEFARIQEAAEKIQISCDALVVIGIGGSYIGARAAIELLRNPFYNQLSKTKRKAPEIYFAGHNISPVYLKYLLEVLEGKEICINVVSKSGTTTEPAIAFRIFRDLLQRKYGQAGAAERIFVTTDQKKGALKKLAVEEGYASFVIPDDIGGRYSVLTAVGLLPIAVSGADIEQIMAGAAEAAQLYNNAELLENDAYLYAVFRNILYRQGKAIELLVYYEPAWHYFGEWWKQLFGESEGKEHSGLFPATLQFSTDLHSMGQYIQEGRRHIFETVINVEQPATDITISEEPDDIDGLNFLQGKTMDYINKQAFAGTMLAHTDGGVPNLVVSVPQINEYYFGSMVYFFEKSCALSGYLLGVNPFNQPGVEAYKKNMFALLGKPGFEEQKAALEKRLKK